MGLYVRPCAVSVTGRYFHSSILVLSDRCVDKIGASVDLSVVFWQVLSEHNVRGLILTKSLWCPRRKHCLHYRNSTLGSDRLSIYPYIPKGVRGRIVHCDKNMLVLNATVLATNAMIRA